MVNIELILKRTLFLVMSTQVLFMLAGCADETPKLTKGRPAPGFELEQLQAGLNEISRGLAGQDRPPSVFWADWCPFCKTEMQDIEPVYQKYRDRDLVILAVNVRQDRKNSRRAFIRKLNVSYDVLLDQEGEVARSYNVIGLPTTTFIIDREGKLHTKILGESTPELFEKIVGELL